MDEQMIAEALFSEAQRMERGDTHPVRRAWTETTEEERDGFAREDGWNAALDRAAEIARAALAPHPERRSERHD